MIVLPQKDKEKEISQSNKVKESLGIKAIDPYLNLQENNNIIDNINDNQNNQNLSLNQNLRSKKSKLRLSLEFIQELLRSPGISEEEKEKYQELAKKIQEEENYLLIYDDIHSKDSDISRDIKNSQISKEKPIVINLPQSLNYDVELYKIGQKCGGLQKRWAIINRGGFSSSKKHIKEMDKKNIKDKTQFLKGALILIEHLDENQKDKGEWSNKTKPFRIKIIYCKDPQKAGKLDITDEKNKKELSQFCLYFDDENKMKEVYLMLFDITLSEEQKQNINNNLGNLSGFIEEGNKFYTLLKILSVKNKIKKRKIVFNKMDSTIKGKMFGQLMIDEKYFIELKKRKLNGEEEREPSEKEPPLKNIPPPRREVFEKQYSDFMPLISSIAKFCGKNSLKKKSLNDLIQKYNLLREEIPEELIEDNNELSQSGICFNIQNGVLVEKDKEKDINNFRLDEELCSNCRYIYFDKNKPEIKFKKENNNEDSQPLLEDEIKDKKFDINDILTDENIHEISNVILNSNININGKEENNLIICGPKSDNNQGIYYEYSDDNINYSDPEEMKIKTKTVNIYNNEEIKGITFQIYQSELDINNLKLQQLINNITRSIFPDLNQENVKNILLFSYIIRICDYKIIESNYVSPKDYKNNICFIEYNNQYFIPDEYKKQDLIIDFYCLPKVSLSEKEKEIPEEKQKYITQLLSPIKIGYAKISYNDILEGKFKYPLQNNGIDEPNSFVILDGGKDKIDNILLKNIKGKDYSIGNDSYIEKIIDKKFIDNSKDDQSIPEEIKDKYFNISFDGNDFLLRPNENMNENEFSNDIRERISPEELSKIKNNKKYTFLPFCEKYIDEKQLYESENLKCLTNDQKEIIKNEFQKGQWIYKCPEIKVKILSKNMGAQDNGISQMIYCTGKRETFPFESLNQFNEDRERVIPISENSFNIFDMKEMEKIENTNNFQWKTGIQFNNEMQMHSFLKLLTLARQNINTKLKNANNDIEFDINEIKNFENGRNNGDFSSVNIPSEINISFVDFINKFELKNDKTYLYFEIYISKEGQAINRLFPLLENSHYGFSNSLIDNDIIRNLINECQSDQSRNTGVTFKFKNKVKLTKDKFNDGNKKITFGNNMKREFTYCINPKKFEIWIETSDQEKFYAPFDTSTINFEQNTICEKYELPLYLRGDNSKIYGCVGIDFYDINDLGQSFEDRFETSNNKYLIQPLLILKEKSNIDITNFEFENYHFGLNEPNVFRRKILNFIHKSHNIDPNNMKNNSPDLNILYQKLYKKCVKLPEPDSFSEFKFVNIKKNFNEQPNSYKKKLALKLLKIVRHEEFLQLFREKEWDLYLNKINKGEKGLPIIEYFKNLTKKQIISEKSNDPETLHNLIYLGIPKKYRKDIYSSFLEIDNLCNETMKILKEKNVKIEIKPPSFKQIIFNYFADHIFENKNETNIIFSLIDNDSTYIYSLSGTTIEDVNSIKKIAKSFFMWSRLNINLKDKERYVYFIGLLSIIQKLKQYFKEDFFVFWILVGLSQNMDHFRQQNPLFTNNMNYINLYGLVIKLIMETHLKKVFDKFISLNFPLEFFISRHLSTLYTDYFNNELMMRIFDILIYESSFKVINDDNLHYLRILCAIPITLFELNENRILACESVSEIESIFNDLILHTFNNNKFIITLEKNVTKYFVYSGFFEKWLWFYNKNGKEWDSKRGDLELLISDNFKSVYEENNKYLSKINNIFNGDAQNFYNNYFDKLKDELKTIQSIYYPQDSNDYSNEITGIMIHISKLQQIFNNDNKDTKDYKLIISFEYENKDDINNRNDKQEFQIDFDNENNKINNLQDLFYKKLFEQYHFPKYIIFELVDNLNNKVASFAYKIFEYEPMKISKITLENKEENNKYFLEFTLFKYTTRNLDANDIGVYNNIFSRPHYIHYKSIEEKLYSYSIGYSFNRTLNDLIKEQNDRRNKILNSCTFDDNLSQMFKKFNNFDEKEDKYNEKIIRNENRNVLQKISNILNSFLPRGGESEQLDENYENNEKKPEEGNIHFLVNEWLKKGNISIEEILYSLILIDKSLISVNEKISLLYSIAQTKDKLLFKNDRLSIDKLKEVIYSLYKRFMIYFTKTDVERMIDFLLKDERFFNIKYAFVHNKNDIEKINEIIYDKDHYEPRIDNKRKFEIYFDNIDKQINIYLNYLNNHYNMNFISKDIFIHILTDILKNNSNFNKYQQKEFNTITIVIEKDNLMLKRYYTIEYSPSLVIKEDCKNNNFEVGSRDSKEILDEELCYEISTFDCTNSYSIDKDISLDHFKELFFKLPYLSDLFRVSFTYINENSNLNEKKFKLFSVTIDYDDDMSNSEFKIRNASINSIYNKKRNYGIYYFVNEEERDEIEIPNSPMKQYFINENITMSDTVDSIIGKISKYINEKFITEDLKKIDKISCFICYYLDENSKNENEKEKKKIGFFDRLYSCVELKDKNFVELKVILNNNSFTFVSNQKLVSRGRAYCKIFYSNNNDFIWKKCNAKPKNISNAKLISTDYKSKPLLNNDDVVLGFNI